MSIDRHVGSMRTTDKDILHDLGKANGKRVNQGSHGCHAAYHCKNGEMVNVRATKKAATECFQEDACRSHGPARLRHIWEGSNLRVRRR